MIPGRNLFTLLLDAGLIEGSWDGLPPERQAKYERVAESAMQYTHLHSTDEMELQSR